jgi:hypothetical protein
MAVSELRQSLPASERTWNAATPEDWMQSYTNNSLSKSESGSQAITSFIH